MYIIYKYMNNFFIGGKIEKKWEAFSHNGVLFPDEYIPHNIPLKYNNQLIKLTPLQEEYAMLYAKYINTDYVKIKLFNKNFWNDWSKILGKDHIITSLDGIDFTEYYNILQKQKEQKKQTEKQNEDKYKYAIVNGKQQLVGNYKIEPPGLFLGRGDNPKIGMVKKRIQPEDIIINIDDKSPIPQIKDHKWKEVIHDNNVEWLASWKDEITGKIKYVWLGCNSEFQALSDMSKFELARKLKKSYSKIMKDNEINLSSDNIKTKQIATALYFIDKFALRVGNEKCSDEADTVGVTSLRVEHMNINNNKVILDFLGKDSVRYYNELDVDNKILENLKFFILNKNKDDQIFDKISSNDINTYLQTFMKNLTARVFRTYNASILFQKELHKIINKFPIDTPIQILLDEYNKANIHVAKLLNHQKNVSKNYKIQVEKINEKLKSIKKKLSIAKKTNNQEKINKLIDKLKLLKNKIELKQELKNLALGTSKINYIDPRITIAFMKVYNIPIDKLMSKNLQQKFSWAQDVDKYFKF